VRGVSAELAKEAMRLAQHKLSIKTRFIARDDLTKSGDEEEK
jgi:large subunit ribosomal protein L16